MIKIWLQEYHFSYPTFTFDNLNDLIEEIDFETQGTLITVNFNPSDKNLTDFLAYATFNDWVNATMYNYVSTRASLTRDLEWALTQGKIFCRFLQNADCSVN